MPTIAEFLRRLMERQAFRHMEQKRLTRKEVEAVGVALMTLGGNGPLGRVM